MELETNHRDFRVTMPDGKLLEVHPESNEGIMEYHTFLEGQPHAVLAENADGLEAIAGDFNLSNSELEFISGKIADRVQKYGI